MIGSLTRKISALLGGKDPGLRQRQLQAVLQRRAELAHTPKGSPQTLIDSIAMASLSLERVLGLRPFDVQITGALAMAEGKIAEMQTGEGKTLTAVMTAYELARQRGPVHVLTANDYLAKRDCEWMGDVYRDLGLTVGYVTQASTPEERRASYDCDILYATPNEIGFDFLRDSLALDPADMVQREFRFALLDEVDSILIDEARIPLVIAGGEAIPAELVRRIDEVVRGLQPHFDYNRDEFGRNVLLTDRGAANVERALRCMNLYDNMALFTAVSDALHVHVLLQRDVDYLVRDGAIQLVDEFKGRIADQRRWPAGLQLALEAKERLALKPQGRILGTITLQSLIRLYERVCGMTGTAETQAEEFRKIYQLEVEVIPTNRPMIRKDRTDVVFPDRRARDEVVAKEVVKAHSVGRPVLVGTASVAESEALSRRLVMAGIPHHVLNARNDLDEARIIAQAGALGAVTISTNMAGRGTDIVLGGNPPSDDGRVCELGGLYVIGTSRHEARRIDNQLRGRAGRQGDPGESRFFISFDDDLLTRFGLRQILTPENFQIAGALDQVQRIIEGQNLEIRQTLFKYDQVLEGQRRHIQGLRRDVLFSENPWRRAILIAIDELWAEYLADVSELKSGIHWVSFGGKDPFQAFLHEVEKLFAEVVERVQMEMQEPRDVEAAGAMQRGATWTYLTSDQPLGDMNQRFFRGVGERVKAFLGKVSS